MSSRLCRRPGRHGLLEHPARRVAGGPPGDAPGPDPDLLDVGGGELEDVLLAEIEDGLVERALQRGREEDDPRIVLALGEERLVERVLHADEKPDRRVLTLDPERDLRLRDLVGRGVLGLLLDDPFEAQRGQGVDDRVRLRLVGRGLNGRGQAPGPGLVPLEGQGLAVADEADLADVPCREADEGLGPLLGRLLLPARGIEIEDEDEQDGEDGEKDEGRLELHSDLLRIQMKTPRARTPNGRT